MPGVYIPGDLALNAAGTDAVTPTRLEQMRQRVTNWFKTPQGTWRYDSEAGCRYYWISGPFQRNVTLQRIEIRRGIMRQPGAVALLKLDITLDAVARVLRVAFTLQTKWGLLDHEMELT